MVHFEVETFPIVMGFACGVTIYLLQWLFPAPVTRSAARASKQKQAQFEGDEEDTREPASPTVSEPQSEPGPEPVPEPAAASSRPLWPGLVLLALFGLLATARAVLALQSGGLYDAPAPLELLPTESLPWSLMPEQAVPPEVATQAEVLNSEADLPVAEAPTSEEEAQIVEASPAVETHVVEASPAVETHVVEASPAVEKHVVEAPPAVEMHVVKAETAGVNHITLNLTRQVMSIQNIGSIIHYKSAYWGTVAVGTPAVDYKVVFDTGSGYFILPSTYCHSETCRAHKRYRRSASSSARDIDFDGTEVSVGEPRDELSISFGTGEVTGVLVDETMCTVAQGVGPDLTTSDCMPLSMIIATEMTEDPFRTFHFDGILGLGLMGLSKSTQFSFIHNVGKHLFEQGARTPSMFSVFLGQNRHEPSDITFGGYVPDHLEDNTVRWNPVLHPELGHWMLAVKSVRVDDFALDFCSEGCRAVVDSGTSLLAVPTSVFPEVHELLRHEAHPLLDCKGPGPKFHIELEGLTLTLEPQDYARSESSLFGHPPKSSIRYPGFRNSTDAEPEYCKPTFMSMELPEPVGPKLFVLGEPVLRKYYTVFDFEEGAPRIGFGRASHRTDHVLTEHDEWDEEEDGWR